MQPYFQRSVSAAPLAVFRIGFGLMLLVSLVRFSLMGWIEKLYIEPRFFFPFYGFEFVVPLGNYTYLLFAVCALSALLFTIGWYYRLASVLLFLSFTYIELIDKTTYLNHYYFISMISLLMIFLPAHVYFSVDAFRNKKLLADRIPQWNLDVIKLFVAMLYFFAGLAKINSDWLLHALPLRIWLPAHNDMPLIGFLFNYSWVHFAFSWIGCLYDLSIPFLLWYRGTRFGAYLAVVIFHLFTALLFPIGMFPYVMMVTALVFFSESFHEKIVLTCGRWLKLSSDFLLPAKLYSGTPFVSSLIKTGIVLFFLVQFFMPFRYLFYEDKLFWTEQGYRFSWRVMLMEKAGYAQFIIKDKTGKEIYVNNSDFLTPLQEKMMSTQPDMILQYAHLLRDHFASEGFKNPAVYAECYVTLNGRLSKPFIQSTTDLAKEEDSFAPKTWILPYNE
jgi:Vitamin K-dependent gamma-carboxylase